MAVQQCCCYRLRCVTSWPAAAEPQSSKTFSSPVAFSRCVNEMISSLSMFVLPSKYDCMVAIIVGDTLCCCIEKGLVILLHTVESIWGSESLEIGNPCICKNILSKRETLYWLQLQFVVPIMNHDDGEWKLHWWWLKIYIISACTYPPFCMPHVDLVMD